MYNFTYQRASSRDDAKAKLGAADDGSYLAGGMTLLPTMKQRLASPSDLVDLAGVSDLAGSRRDGDAPQEVQVWVVDPTGPQGYAATNALKSTTM